MQVHHLIEECIVFNMGKKECMDALFKHANINPIITSTGTYTRIYIYTHKCTHTRHMNTIYGTGKYILVYSG